MWDNLNFASTKYKLDYFLLTFEFGWKWSGNNFNSTIVNSVIKSHFRRYDTIKLADEISLNFPELSIKGKYVKNGLKNRGSPYYFLSSRDQKIKN